LIRAASGRPAARFTLRVWMNMTTIAFIPKASLGLRGDR
jgi:hypothetical protein